MDYLKKKYQYQLFDNKLTNIVLTAFNQIGFYKKAIQIKLSYYKIR